LDHLADFRAAGESNLVDIRMLDDGRSGFTGAGDDIDDAGRQLRFLDDAGQQQRRKRRRLRGLKDDGVAARQGRSNLPSPATPSGCGTRPGKAYSSLSAQPA
jgi:hypothetical protein